MSDIHVLMSIVILSVIASFAVVYILHKDTDYNNCAVCGCDISENKHFVPFVFSGAFCSKHAVELMRFYRKS